MKRISVLLIVLAVMWAITQAPAMAAIDTMAFKVQATSSPPLTTEMVAKTFGEQTRGSTAQAITATVDYARTTTQSAIGSGYILDAGQIAQHTPMALGAKKTTAGVAVQGAEIAIRDGTYSIIAGQIVKDVVQDISGALAATKTEQIGTTTAVVTAQALC